MNTYTTTLHTCHDDRAYTFMAHGYSSEQADKDIRRQVERFAIATGASVADMLDGEWSTEVSRHD